MKKISKFLSVVLAACMIFGMLPALSVSAADDAPGGFMEITSNNYLSTVGSNAFNVFMYDNTFSGTFGDQHMGGIEMSLNGVRIATNGDLHLLPTPEQWDATPAPSRGSITRDRETNTITVPMTFSGATDGTLRYDLIASPTAKGMKLQMILRTDMPESLKGKARFNLELRPASYKNKSYQADLNGDGVYDSFGVFPLHPQDAMIETERVDLPSQAWYVKEWNVDRGDDQPAPFATAYGFSLSPEDKQTAITFTSNTDDKMELLDGRNRAQNGWYVLSTVISATKAGETAIEWIVEPDVDPNWVREPNVGFSQVGYTPGQEKFAVVELDKWDNDYPKTMSLWRVNADGSEENVCEKELGATTDWMRFKYARFDFTEVTQAGLYRIHYGDYVGEIFPIAKTVYEDVWHSTLSGFLAVQMDHIVVREGYKIWHGASHMDDGVIGDRNSSWFDGMQMQTMPQAIRNKGYKGEDHVEGLNKGGWFDAGDFDLQISRNVGVLGNLVNVGEICGRADNYDDLSVTWDDETGGLVEMHRPDGIPDIVEQCIHGVKQLLAEYECLGGTTGCMEVRTLRQYTHLGDPSSDTDGWIYDPNLSEGEVVERDGKVYSGVPDDRYFLTAGGGGSFSAGLSQSLVNSFAGTAYMAVDYPATQEYAQHVFNTCISRWKESNWTTNWDTVVQFTLASEAFERNGVAYDDQDTLSAAYFKGLLDELIPNNLNAGSHINVLALKHLLTEEQWAQVGESVANQNVSVNNQPYGVNFTSGASWGSSPNTYSGVRNISFMYYHFPLKKFEQNILRSVNYLMGRHPATNSSWISGVGTKSMLHPYNSNRAEESYIPGSILPGHITFSDYVESMDDFNFLWFENESIISYQASWLPVGIAAGHIAANEPDPEPAETKDFESSFDAELVTKTSTSMWGGGSSNYYFSDDGFNMIMYATTFDRTFGDQHCAGIELIQNGRRIATNGDIHLLPTPEQWDATPPPTKGTVTAEGNTVTVPMTIPAETFDDGTPENPAVSYKLIAEPEPGGIKLTVKLDAPLPEDLVGKAGFNMEFLPAVFIGKSYQTDSDGDGTYDDFGVFPQDPRDEMVEMERARTNNQAWYVQEWNEDRGDYQPVPFSTGTKMTLAAETDDYRLRISCDDGLALYDGRNRAQNGWFVMRTLIPADATEIVWHISPDTNSGWVREPNITHSQVGYEPELDKVAVIELDPNYVGPAEAKLLKVESDGSYTEVLSKALGEAKSWQRYIYKDFDFSEVKARGTYVIEYDGYKSDPFAIDKHVYSDIWTESVGNYMAVQMDHMRIREGYKIWRNAAHMDDALQAPVGVSYFDGQSMGASSDSPYEAYEHIPGLDVGGFSDAGDFDIQVAQNLSVINTLALAAQVYGNDYDTLDVNWETHNVELHRSDGTPDIVQLAKHGALNIMAQLDAVGYTASVIEVPTLRQYTHLGDGSKDTDNRIYDPSLAADETVGLRSGKRDDRLAFFQTKSTSNVLNAATALAAAASVLSDDDPDKAKFLAWAEKIWNDEPDSHVGTEGGGGWFSSGPADWNLALELFYATGKEVYKDRILECLDTQLVTSGSGWFGPAFASSGYKVVKVIDKLGDEAKEKFEAALTAYAPSIGQPNASNPYGVSDTTGMWGGSGGVVSGAIMASVLHKYYPDVVSADSVFRAINYILGTHPYNSTSWISGVGTNSLKKGYGSNRADFYYIAGGLAPGYVTIAPDFPEALDDFNFLWFENEYTVEVTANWILLTLGAEDFARESDVPCEHDWQSKVTEPTCTKGGYTTYFCNNCFESYVDDYTEALGHDYDDGVVTRPPSAMFDGVMTYTCRRCGDSYKVAIPKTGAGTELVTIDFTKAADADKYAILGQETAEVVEGEGITLVSLTGGVEPAKRNIAERERDVIDVPVKGGDWTATLKFNFDAKGAGGAWAFFGYYAAEGEGYQNMLGVRGGNGALQNFERHDGTITHEDEDGVNSAPGLARTGEYQIKISKAGDTYTCFRSDDGGLTFDEMFSYEESGINADKLIIDAYSGRDEGYTFVLKSLDIEYPAAMPEWVLADEIEPGKQYIVVASEAYALTCEPGQTSISSSEVTVEGDKITSEVSEGMVWIFEAAEPASDGSAQYYLYNTDEKALRRSSTSLAVADFDESNVRYYNWAMIEREDPDEGYTFYQSGTSRYAMSGTAANFSLSRVSSSSGNIQTAGTPVKLYTLTAGGSQPKPKPEVSGITVDGVAIEGFEAKVKSYAVGVADGVTKVPEVAAIAGNADTVITVTQAEGIPGEAVIEAVAGEKSLIYTVSFDYGPKDDYFADGAMNAGQWTILNEVKDPTEEEPYKYYRFDKGVGLVMPTQHNSIYQKATPGAWSNMFTMSGGGDWEVVAKAFYPLLPDGNYQQVQFIAWQDEDNYVRINCQDSRRRTEPFYEKAGTAVNQNNNAVNNAIPLAEDGTMTMYFKINKAGNTYTLSYSEDGLEWKSGGVYEAALTNVKVAVFCTQDYQPTQSNYKTPVELAFEYVAVTSRNGEAVRTDAETLTWAAQNAADYIAADLPAETAEDLVLSPAPHGYTVELSSSDPAVIAADGKVTPAESAKDVVVTVKVSEGDVTASASKTIRVAGGGSGEPEFVDPEIVPIEHPEIPIFENTEYSFRERAADLIGRMTLTQKASEITSQSAPAISAAQLGGGALNVPATKGLGGYTWWSETLHGCRSGVNYPQNTTVASTWNPDLYYQESTNIGQEIRERNNTNLNFYSPTINMHRDPRWGRNEESYSEDVYLTAQMGIAWVQGLEGKDREGNVLDPDGYLMAHATIKHYVANNNEGKNSGDTTGRLRAGAISSLRMLREYYALPYGEIIRGADISSVMTAYNYYGVEEGKFDPSSYSSYLMDTLLRQVYGFNGHITSDCDSVCSMQNLHYINYYTGQEITAAEAMAGALAHGEDLECNGGHSSSGSGTSGFHTSYGAQMNNMLGLETDKGIFTENTVDISLHRLMTARFQTGDFDGDIQIKQDAAARQANATELRAERRELVEQINGEGVVMLQNKGMLPLDLSESGVKSIAIVGSHQTSTNTGLYAQASRNELNIQQGIVNAVTAKKADVEFTLITANTLTEENIAAITAADAVIVVTGTTSSYSQEDRDRASIVLPDEMENLIPTVGKLNPNTVVVMETCGPMRVKAWQDDVNAILWSSFGGQWKTGFGDVISGKVNPSGKTTDTWYQDVADEGESDVPPITDYELLPSEGKNGRTYMYYDGYLNTRAAKAPSYPFGYGLSYTTFAYSNLKIDKTAYDANETVKVSFDVKNTGSVAGKETTQLYVAQPEAPAELKRPIRRLEGFQKIELQPGETKTVSMEVKIEDLAFFDEAADCFVVDQGAYQVQVGTNSMAAADLTADFTVSGELIEVPAVLTVKANAVGDNEKGIEQRLIYGKHQEVNPQVTVAMNNEKLYGYIIAQQHSNIKSMQSTPLPEGMKLHYFSNRPEVVKVEGDKVYTVGPGVATLTVTAAYNGVQVSGDAIIYVMTNTDVEDLTVNGETVEKFNPQKYSYKMTLGPSDPIPVVAATASNPDLEITVEQATELPGVATVTCKDTESGVASVYTITFKVKNPSTGGGYVLVNEIEPGGQYVIVADDEYALSLEDGAIIPAEVSVADDKIVSEVTEGMIWTIEDGSDVLGAAADESPLYLITDAEGNNLRRSSSALAVEEYADGNVNSYGWSFIEREEDTGVFTFYNNSNRGNSYRYAVTIGEDGVTNARVSSSSGNILASGSPVKLYQLVGGGLPDIDFTDPADAYKYDIAGQTESEVDPGTGLALVARQGGVEPAKQSIAEQDIDVVKIPVGGDWTATLETVFDANGAANGYYQFFGFYASQGGDNQNMVGIRGGDGAMQDFIRSDGAITEETQSSAPGFASAGTYFLRIEKEGDKYTCYRSEDGENFTQMFAYEGTGIEADQIIIDAYTGMTEGYKFTLKSLKFEGGQAAPVVVKAEVASITVDGEDIGFDPDVAAYNITVARDSTNVPVVAAVAGNKDTQIAIEQLDGPFGTATVTATAGKKTKTYTLSFNFAAQSDYFADGDYDQTLWTILNENSETYSVEKGKGIVMPTQRYDVYQTGTGWYNAFVSPAMSNWEVVTKVFFPARPSANYQQAQVLFWQDENNFIRMNLQNTGENLVIEPGREVKGSFTAGSTTQIEAAEDGSVTIYFKLKNDSGIVSAAYSLDGAQFKEVYTAENVNYADPQIALFSSMNQDGDPIDTYFEYVYVAARDGLQPDFVEMLNWAAKNVADYIAADLPAEASEDLVLSPAPHGYTVTLTSSDPAVIAADGKVTPAAEDKDVTVTVTAAEGDAAGTSAAVTIRVPGSGVTPPPKPDYAALNSAIAAAEAVDKSLYTDESVAAMEAALAAAKAALSAEDQAAVDAAAEALNAAVAALEVKPGPGPEPGDLEELYRLAREALARAQAAQQAAEDALAAALAAGGVDTEAIEAAKAAAEAAKTAAEQAAAAAEAAKAAAEASDADAAAQAAAAAQSAADAAEQAAAAARAQAAAQRAQAAAEKAQKAAEDAAALTAADKVAAEAAQKAAEDAKAAAEAAKAAAQAADVAAAEKAAASAASAAEAARAQAAAQAAQAAAEAAEKAAEEAQAKAEQAAAQASADAAAAEAAKAAAEAAKAAAENAKAAAENAKAAAAASNASAAEAAASAAQSAAQVAEARKQIADAQAEIAAIQAKADQAAIEAAAAKAAAEAALKAAEAAELSAAKYAAKALIAATVYGADVPVEQKDAFDAAAAAGRAAVDAAEDKAAVEKALADALKALEDACIDSCPSKNFTDVPPAGNWAHAGIDYCVANDLMNGIDATTFAPDSSTTRAQFATILYRAVGKPAVEYKGTFSDVPDGMWYSDAIEWAASTGVVNGVGEGRFNPDGKITREQIAAMLYRFSNSPKVEGNLNAFRDAADVSDYAVNAMIWAVKEGIINGVGEGDSVALAPKANATRAQIATIFARFLAE